MAKKNDASAEDIRFRVMMDAMILGITPEDLAEFYKIVIGMDIPDNERIMREEPVKTLGRGRSHSKSGSGRRKCAADRTLKLRVQMQGVKKPPMWRELKIPADFSFYQLHLAIQAACGFEDAHLWQFQYKPYDSTLQIGVPKDDTDPYGMGLEDCTHDARQTDVAEFLSEKGDKLVYVYDFGDDWIFNVSVVDVVARDGEVAECTRWKSDLQPMEDSGGMWSYLEIRSVMDHPDSLTKRQKEEFADSMGFESFDCMMEVISDCMFDPETVNEALAEI